MTDYTRTSTGQEQHSCPDPADQPRPPGAEDCTELHTEKATETSAFKVVAVYRLDAPVK